jgi:polysaccharide export outer membrane protein
MKQLFISICITLLLTACSSNKNIAYFQDIPQTGHLISDTTLMQAETRICTGDILSITVSALDPTAVLPFNLPVVAYSAPGSDQVYSSPSLQGYVVDSKGFITFPVLGDLKVSGLKRSELLNLLKDKLSPYLKDPVITLKFLNYNVTVLGEVARPGTYTINNERVTILQALGLAGDITIFGKKDNVLLVRDNDGKKEYIRINFNQLAAMNSPYYFLQQNDVLIVEPNKTKIISSETQNASLYISIISTLVTATAVVYSIVKK